MRKGREAVHNKLIGSLVSCESMLAMRRVAKWTQTEPNSIYVDGQRDM